MPPDISMCLDADCPARHQCFRHEASGTKPNPYRQTVADFHHDETGKCDSFWPSPYHRSALQSEREGAP